MKLTKIGPGLGPRLSLWQKIYVWFSDIQMEPLTEFEKDALRRLANGVSWEELVPEEWRNMYAAIYDEYDTIVIDEREKTKIDKDVPRTFTLFSRYTRHLKLNFPEDLSEYYDALTKVLRLASIGRGYCQGVNFIAAKLLLELADDKEAFIILSYLLKNCQLEILFDSRYSALFDYMRIFEKKLRNFNNKLYKHLKKCEFRSSSYAIEWFTTCFIVTCPGEIALCVLDMVLSGINDIMIRMGLSLLSTLQHRLLRLDFEKLHETFKDYCMKSDTVYVVVQALKIQFQADNSVLKAMARKIESLDPTSGGDLMFGKPKKVETPKSNVRVSKFRRNRTKTSTPVTLPSDDSLSEEGEIEDDPVQLDGSQSKPIELTLKVSVESIDSVPETTTNESTTDTMIPPEELEEVHRNSNSNNSKSKRKSSKLTIKVSPKRFNQWKHLRKQKHSPEETDPSLNIDERVLSSFPDIITDDQEHSHILLPHEKESLIKPVPSPSKLKPVASSSSEKSSDKSGNDINGMKSPSWWNWKVPGFRSGKNHGESSGHSSKHGNEQGSAKSSFSAPTSGGISPTNSSSPPPPLNRRDTNNSTKSELPSHSVDLSDPHIFSSASRLYRRTRILEKFTVCSLDEEEETIRQFYLTENHDTLLILHFQPISLAMDSLDDGDLPPMKSNERLRTGLANDRSPSKGSRHKFSLLSSFRSSSDPPPLEEKVDVVNIDPLLIRSENQEYIDQGGEVISANFYRTNHLIAEILETNGLIENYFEGKEREEKKIIRTSKQGISPREKKSDKGKSRSEKNVKNGQGKNGQGFRNSRVKAADFDSRHDSEVLQNAMYYSFSQALYK